MTLINLIVLDVATCWYNVFPSFLESASVPALIPRHKNSVPRSRHLPLFWVGITPISPHLMLSAHVLLSSAMLLSMTVVARVLSWDQVTGESRACIITEGL
jgi:hypothetical protein